MQQLAHNLGMKIAIFILKKLTNFPTTRLLEIPMIKLAPPLIGQKRSFQPIMAIFQSLPDGQKMEDFQL